jgi:hypothetical protein
MSNRCYRVEAGFIGSSFPDEGLWPASGRFGPQAFPGYLLRVMPGTTNLPNRCE